MTYTYKFLYVISSLDSELFLFNFFFFNQIRVRLLSISIEIFVILPWILLSGDFKSTEFAARFSSSIVCERKYSHYHHTTIRCDSLYWPSLMICMQILLAHTSIKINYEHRSQISHWKLKLKITNFRMYSCTNRWCAGRKKTHQKLFFHYKINILF